MSRAVTKCTAEPQSSSARLGSLFSSRSRIRCGSLSALGLQGPGYLNQIVYLPQALTALVPYPPGNTRDWLNLGLLSLDWTRSGTALTP